MTAIEPDAQEPERITAAALQIDGKIVTEPPPARHHNLIRRWCAEHGGRIPKHEQGFMTSRGRFVHRAAAAAIAHQAGQIAEPKHRLYSEDVW